MNRIRLAALIVATLVSVLAHGAGPAQAAPIIDSFTVSLLAAPDKYQLAWDTTGAVEAFIVGSPVESTFAQIGSVPVDGTRTVVTGWGSRRYTLAVRDSNGVWTYQSLDTPMAVPPDPVTVTSANPHVIDYFRSPDITSPLPDHTITWDKNGADAVKVRRCVGTACEDLGLEYGTSLSVSGVLLASANGDGTFSGLLAPSGQGEVVYELTACTARPNASLFCGESAKAYVQVAAAQVQASSRVYRPLPTTDLTVTWDANGGNWFYVDAPTLGVVNHLTSASSYTFPFSQQQPTPGLHTITVKSCKAHGGWVLDCAMLHQHHAASAGVVSDLAAIGDPVHDDQLLGASVAMIGGTAEFPTRAGRVVSNCGCDGQYVAAGTVLATIETNDHSVIQLDTTGATWSTEPWTDDFDPDATEYIQIAAHQSVRGASRTTVNGTTIRPNGDIYALGEFVNAAAYVSGSIPEIRSLPFRHSVTAAGNALSTVRPFALLGAQSTRSNSQDSFQADDGSIWSTQGWAGGYAPLHNHSRVYRYDPGGTDNQSTPYDDRFCAYNVPGDHNDVMGVTVGDGRVWFIEARMGHGDHARLSWFDPQDPAFADCAAQNDLDYGIAEPYPTPAFSADYCPVAGQSAADCFGWATIPNTMGAPAHLAYDADENALWMSSYAIYPPLALAHYDIDTGEFTVYPLPHDDYAPTWEGTWKVEVADGYVYVADYRGGSIIRFDKSYADRANGDCEALVQGENPCISEVHLPAAGAVQTHVHGDRLYFTANAKPVPLANAQPMFGYVDLDDWGAITTYTGLEDLVAPERSGIGRPEHNWFDVDPGSGMVALGDAQRGQFLRLVPW